MDLKVILDITVIIGLAIAGVFAVIGKFDKEQQDKEDRAEETETRVVLLLKEQVSALEKKVEVQAKLLGETTKKLDMLVKENQVLKDVLQGRDTEFIEYQKLGRQSMKEVEEVLKIVKDNSGIIRNIDTYIRTK